MANPFQEFYNSTAWKQCREAYKHKVAYLCERCGAPGVIVHHKIRVTAETIKNPEVLLNFDNLELLCMRCHNKEHEKENPRFKKGIKRHDASKDRYRVDEYGRVSSNTSPSGAQKRP